MQRFRALVSVLLAFSVYPVFSQRTIFLNDGKIIDQALPSSTVPTRDVDVKANGVIVTYLFNSAAILNDDLCDNAFLWKIEGFGYEEELGKPSVLFRIDRIAVPFGSQAKVEVIETSYKDFSIELAPARLPLTDRRNETYSKNDVTPIKPSLGFYPKKVVEPCETQIYRNNEILGVKVPPIQYDAKHKTVRAYSKIKYRVSFLPNTSVSTRDQRTSHNLLTAEDHFLSNTTLNETSSTTSLNLLPEHPWYSRYAIPIHHDYLIISTPKYSKAVEIFARWKRILGFKVHVSLRDDWTSSRVLTTIKNTYRRNKHLYYLLIIGDQEDVPANVSKLKGRHVTDLFYGCMDGANDYTPDIRRGRIPVNTSEEAITVVNKIIQYESSPCESPSFYKNGLNCAYFQDENKDGYADRRFAQTAEEVRNYLTTFIGKNIQRAYIARSDVNPKNWNKGYYSEGAPLPRELRKPYFKWDANKTNITSAINDGVFYVLHRDHGDVSFWGDPAYSQNDIYSLSNGNKLPIVFSINCLTGKFDQGTCFAETFLRKSHGGCVGIFAATEVSYSGYNDVLSGGLFDAIWPSPGLRITLPTSTSTGEKTPFPSYRLGQILDQGLARMVEIYGHNADFTHYTQELFHCFGDPSMRIYTKVPTPFREVEVQREGNRIRVFSDDYAEMSFYDPTDNTVSAYKGRFISIETKKAQELVVCVSKHNKIPHIDYGNAIFIQNEVIRGSKTYDGGVVRIGTNVTMAKPYGDVTFESGTIVIKGSRIEIHPNTTIKKESQVTLIAK